MGLRMNRVIKLTVAMLLVSTSAFAGIGTIAVDFQMILVGFRKLDGIGFWRTLIDTEKNTASRLKQLGSELGEIKLWGTTADNGVVTSAGVDFAILPTYKSQSTLLDVNVLSRALVSELKKNGLEIPKIEINKDFRTMSTLKSPKFQAVRIPLDGLNEAEIEKVVSSIQEVARVYGNHGMQGLHALYGAKLEPTLPGYEWGGGANIPPTRTGD